MPVVGADDPDVPVPEPTVAPTTVAPETTVPVPTTLVSPPTTAPSTTTAARPAPTTTTPPRGSTTTSVPPTTAEPVDDATIAEASGGGYAATPAPLIPSIEDDPLFHAARLVDDDLRNLSLAKLDLLDRATTTRNAAAFAAVEQASYDEVLATDRDAREHLDRTRSILRAAALHAYTGYGTADEGTGDGISTVSAGRTYVRVTIADATRHVTDAEAARSRTRAALETARDDHRRVTDALATARAEQRSAQEAVDEAQEKLDRDRLILRLQVGAMADFAPGAFDDLPDVVELPEGAIPVESPVGTIVVPASADPRTAIALDYIIAQMGKPYIWGGTGPTGYDCSGLMLRGFQAAGVTSMPRVSQAQQVWATPIGFEDLQPGDFVFFGTPAYHIGVYIGGGLMINAPYTGARVRVDRVWSTVSGFGRAVW